MLARLKLKIAVFKLPYFALYVMLEHPLFKRGAMDDFFSTYISYHCDKTIIFAVEIRAAYGWKGLFIVFSNGMYQVLRQMVTSQW